MLHKEILGIHIKQNKLFLKQYAIRFPNTLKLAIASMIVAVIIGIFAGLISALKHNSWLDVTSTTFALAGISIPNFWLGALLIFVFAVNLQWLPVGGLSEPFYTVEGIKQLDSSGHHTRYWFSGNDCPHGEVLNARSNKSRLR